MNILITSVGRRGYMIEYLKNALGGDGEVHVSNSQYTYVFEYADKSVITPLCFDKEYIPFIKDYCRENNIDIIISLFDVDLPILSKNKEEFEKDGIRVIVSDYDVIRICNDKWLTYKFLSENNFYTPKTYIDISMLQDDIQKGEISYPIVIKPRWGMGSIGVFTADNEEELIVLYRKAKKAMMNSYLKYESKEDMEHSIVLQEMLTGQEYGMDVINDLEGNFVSAVVRRKIAMRAGETDIAHIENNSILLSEAARLGRILRHTANLDCDVFLVNNTPYILEMNARFGGGYPFSHIAGVDLPLAIVKWVKKEDVDVGEMLTAKSGVKAYKNITLEIIEE